jgi:hypothetical protein
MQISYGSVADWAQTISSTVVLVLIYKQMRLTSIQLRQAEDYERSRMSWDFIKFCHEELADEREISHHLERYEEIIKTPESKEFKDLIDHYYRPRVHVFALLNQLLHHQDVEERMLFGYLEEDFNRFIELGILKLGHKAFTQQLGPRLDLVITLWGSKARVKDLLFGNKGTPMATNSVSSSKTDSPPS